MKNTQIHVVKSLIYTIVVTITVGFIIFIGSQRYYTGTIKKSELAHATQVLDALKALRDGENKVAVELLEQDLSTSAASLNVGPEGVSKVLHKNMKDKLEDIKDYQMSKEKKSVNTR